MNEDRVGKPALLVVVKSDGELQPTEKLVIIFANETQCDEARVQWRNSENHLFVQSIEGEWVIIPKSEIKFISTGVVQGVGEDGYTIRWALSWTK